MNHHRLPSVASSQWWSSGGEDTKAVWANKWRRFDRIPQPIIFRASFLVRVCTAHVWSKKPSIFAFYTLFFWQMGKNLDVSNSYPDEGTHDLIDERSTLVDHCMSGNRYLQKLEKQTAEWNTSSRPLWEQVAPWKQEKSAPRGWLRRERTQL